MKVIAALGVASAVAMFAAAPADARQGCGQGFHRSPNGVCRPNRDMRYGDRDSRYGDRDMRDRDRGMHDRWVEGRYYSGRGYWWHNRWYQHRHRRNGVWIYL